MSLALPDTANTRCSACFLPHTAQLKALLALVTCLAWNLPQPLQRTHWNSWGILFGVPPM